MSTNKAIEINDEQLKDVSGGISAYNWLIRCNDCEKAGLFASEAKTCRFCGSANITVTEQDLGIGLPNPKG